jgi:hypothetical protein
MTQAQLKEEIDICFAEPSLTVDNLTEEKIRLLAASQLQCFPLSTSLDFGCPASNVLAPH